MEGSYDDLIHQALDYYDTNSEKLIILLKTNSTSFKEECMNYVEKTRVLVFKNSSLKIYYEDFLVSGLFAIVTRWIGGGKKESKKRLRIY